MQRVAGVADEAEQLERFLVELQDAQDPVAFYDRTIQASAKRRHGSGLGLARIRAEGEMELSHRIAGGRISIVAEAALAEGDLAEVGTAVALPSGAATAAELGPRVRLSIGISPSNGSQSPRPARACCVSTAAINRGAT